jgi:hypothetical protein
LIQILSLLLVLEILLSQTFQMIIEPKKRIDRYWVLILMTGLLHNALFYIALSLDRYTNIEIIPFLGSYTAWSAVRIFHLFFMWGLIEFMRSRVLWFMWKEKHPEGFINFLKKELKRVAKSKTLD